MQKKQKQHTKLSADNNFFKFPIPLIEELIKSRLSGAESSMMLFIIRQTYGWGKQSDIITIKQFQANTNLKKNAIMNALKKFKKLGWINIEKQTFKEGGHKANKITILLGVDVVNENNRKKAEKELERRGIQKDTHSASVDTVEPTTGIQMDTHNAKTGIQMDTHNAKTGIQMDTHNAKTGIQMDTHNGYPKTDLTIDIKNQYIKESIDTRISIDKDSSPCSGELVGGDVSSVVETPTTKLKSNKDNTMSKPKQTSTKDTKKFLRQKPILDKYEKLIMSAWPYIRRCYINNEPIDKGTLEFQKRECRIKSDELYRLIAELSNEDLSLEKVAGE